MYCICTCRILHPREPGQPIGVRLSHDDEEMNTGFQNPAFGQVQESGQAQGPARMVPSLPRHNRAMRTARTSSLSSTSASVPGLTTSALFINTTTVTHAQETDPYRPDLADQVPPDPITQLVPKID